MDWVEFKVNGPAELIGPEKTVLQGGVIAFWIKTTGERGTVTIKAHTSMLASQEITVEIV